MILKFRDETASFVLIFRQRYGVFPDVGSRIIYSWPFLWPKEVVYVYMLASFQGGELRIFLSSQLINFSMSLS